MNYVHPHTHTTFSFGGGACRIPELVAAAGIEPKVEPAGRPEEETALVDVRQGFEEHGRRRPTA
jgi:hypothetical protein